MPRKRTVYRELIKKQGRNMADYEIRPAPGGFKLDFGSTSASIQLTGSEKEKSHAACKLCYTTIKSRCIVIVGTRIIIESNCWVP